MADRVTVCPFRCGDSLECDSDEQDRWRCCRALGPAANVKAVLLYAPDSAHAEDLARKLAVVPGCSLRATAEGMSAHYRDLTLRFIVAHDPEQALASLHAGYFNLFVVDLRTLHGRDQEVPALVARAERLIDSMDSEPDIETRYGFHRLVTLVSGGDDDRVDHLIATLGSKGVGRVLRDRSCSGAGRDTPERAAHFGELFLREALWVLRERGPGRRALCTSGGGITGIYFEMGVLKCLDDCLGEVGVQGLFDMFYGLSAGAVVMGLLANGYSIDEGMAAIANFPHGRIPPLSLRLLRVAHIDFSDMRERLLRATRSLGRRLLRRVRHGDGLSAESALFQLGDLFGPPMRGDSFEHTLRWLFSQPGTTNDFRGLPRPLYVGVTDQDTRSHVIFGDTGHEDVPISLAIQASFSINPAFSSTRVGDRYYEDGAVTQTSNFPDAIAKGADLIFIVDPFVPYVSQQPGFSRQRGLLYNADQNLRTLSYTRFEKYRNATLRRYPYVSSYTFLPANRLRRLMSVNPMDHRPYLAIWKAAYLSTLQRVRALRYRMCGDLAVHGAVLDTAKAEEVAARLSRTAVPALADFFPDGRIELRRPQRPLPPPVVGRRSERHAPRSAAEAAGTRAV